MPKSWTPKYYEKDDEIDDAPRGSHLRDDAVDDEEGGLPREPERIAATLAAQRRLDEPSLRAAFAMLDVDGDGVVDVLSASWGDNVVAWYGNDGSFTKHIIRDGEDGSSWYLNHVCNQYLLVPRDFRFYQIQASMALFKRERHFVGR